MDISRSVERSGTTGIYTNTDTAPAGRWKRIARSGALAGAQLSIFLFVRWFRSHRLLHQPANLRHASGTAGIKLRCYLTHPTNDHVLKCGYASPALCSAALDLIKCLYS